MTDPYSQPSPFEAMQMAVDIVNSSPHPTNKIAATLCGRNKQGESYTISRTNYWPEIIEQKIGQERIGNSSGSIHAETACILAAPCTEEASLFITDPFCPNCAKNVAEAGIKTIYIDHKGFDKDFALRRGDHFERMSMRICERAGISVFEIHRKEQKLVPILEIPEDFEPHEDAPVEYEETDLSFADLVHQKAEKHYDRNFATALAQDDDGHVFALTARSHPAVGYSMQSDHDEIEHPEGKYSFILEPLNRLLMTAPRYGLKLVDGAIYASQVPNARAQVNLVGAGITRIRIGDTTEARNEDALQAVQTLSDHGVLQCY